MLAPREQEYEPVPTISLFLCVCSAQMLRAGLFTPPSNPPCKPGPENVTELSGWGHTNIKSYDAEKKKKTKAENVKAGFT